MLTCDELQTLIFQVVIHDTLIVASHSDGPLFDFAHETLVTLRGNTRDIAVCIRVLSTQFIGIVREDILQSNVNGSIRTASEERVFWELLTAIYFLRKRVVTSLFVLR